MSADDHADTPPVIGITGRRYPAGIVHGAEMQAAMSGIWIEAFYTSYAERLGALGAIPLYVTRQADPAALLARLDGVVLAGGIDVDPRLYGSQPTEHSTVLDPAQDEWEIALTRLAVERGVPVLGTCRGHELLNVAFGGTLREHLEGLSSPHHRRIIYPLQDRGHRVETATDSKLRELYGPTAEVNRLGEGVRACAYAEDEVIEAIEIEGADAIGVQWHPEFVEDAEPILGWLVERARAFAAARAIGAGEAS
ncbi:MAG: gamma-glutamyl-gamma-aminobutyrate hydrolase family protein [Actinobacteria bacterium]|nr:gamma-glutamyl-gamma-aminobutyrate hydrolase family protein [Actinomycetota bacterium]